MSEKIDLNISLDGNILNYSIKILDKDLYGKDIFLTLYNDFSYKVGENSKENIFSKFGKNKFSVNKTKNLYSEKLNIYSDEKKGQIDLEKLNFYSYDGKYIEINSFLEVSTSGFLFFKEKTNKKFEYFLENKKDKNMYFNDILNKKDKIDYKKNLSSLENSSKYGIYTLIFFSIFLLISSVGIPIYDLNYSDSNYLFFSNSREYFFNIFGILVINIFSFIFVYFIIKKLLLSYVDLYSNKNNQSIESGKNYYIGDFVGGKANIDLKNITFNIVACNVEKGVYKEEKYSDYVTKIIRQVRQVNIFTKNIELIDKGTDISYFLNDSISFDKIFEELYPKQIIGENHGVDLYLEFQIISDDLIDKNIPINFKNLNYKDFINVK